MSTASVTYPVANSPSYQRSLGDYVKIFGNETKYEFLKLARTRSFSLATIGFPVMFYVLFGVSNSHVVSGDVHIAKYMLGGYACFGLIGAALFGIGVGLASEINAGWLDVKRASPMPPLAYLFAKLMTAIAFGLIIVAILIGIGVLFGGVTLSAVEVAKMLGLTVVGSIVFASLGLLLGQIVPANAAPGIINLIYLPMSFASGLWIPLRNLPHFIRTLAPALPTYHLAQLMLSIFGKGYVDAVPASTHWFGLLGFMCVMVGTGWAVFSRRQQAS